jgi:hypothetical protein
MDDTGEEAALRPPLHAEWELSDSDEEFPLLAQIGANPFGQESKASAKAAAGGSLHADSLVAEGETTVTDPAVQGSVGESSQKTVRGRGGRHLGHGTKARAARYQLPFLPLEALAHVPSSHLELRRFDALPSHMREAQWWKRRKHAPCDMMVPLDLGLDALYFRAPEEREYAERLAQLKVEPGVGVSANLLLLSTPLIPYHWPLPQCFCPRDFRNFSPNGDLPNPDGGEIALDSALALRDGSIADQAGDPGRMLAETRKETRNLRVYQEFAPYHQVEFYAQIPEARRQLYPYIPPWWSEVQVLPNMMVPLPPVLTYRGSRFLSDYRGTPEGEFYERVLETEWTASIFARWCSDIPQRGIQWRLLPRVRENIAAIGLDMLLRGSRYSVSDVEFWLGEHDTHPWEARTQENLVRGPTNTGPAISQTLFEFVRIFGSSPSEQGKAWEIPGATGPSAASSVTRARSGSGAGSSAMGGEPQVLPYPIIAVAAAPMALATQTASVDPRGNGLRSRPLAQGISFQGDGSHVLRRISRDIPIPRLDPDRGAGVASSRETPRSIDRVRAAIDRDPVSVTHEERPQMDLLSSSLSDRLYEMGLWPTVQAHARWSLQRGDSADTEVPMTEELLVSWIDHLDRTCRELSRTADRVRVREQQTAQECEERVRRAEARSDLLAAAYSVASRDPEDHGAKRSRYD